MIDVVRPARAAVAIAALSILASALTVLFDGGAFAQAPPTSTPTSAATAESSGESSELDERGDDCDDDPSQSYCPAPPPTRLRLSTSGDDLSLSYTRSYWESHSSHYYKFTLYRSSTENGTYRTVETVNDNSSPATFEDVDSGYWYKARGVRCLTSIYSVCGDWSSYSSAIEFGEVDDPTEPAAPAAPESEPDGRARNARISWTAPDDGGSTITGYRVQYRRTTVARWTQRTWRPRYTRSELLGGLTRGAAYFVQVQARNAEGEGDWSAATRFEVPYVTPDEPDDVEAEGRYRSVHVEWDVPDDDGGRTVTGYRVQHRRSGATQWSRSGWISRYSRNHTVDVDRDNTRYQIQVQARNSVGESEWSSSSYAVTATTPGRVSRPSASEDGVSITVSWTAPHDGRSPITGYEIQYRRASHPSWEGSRAAVSTSRSYIFAGLEADTRYEFQVRAGNRVGNGAYSLSRYETTDDVPGRMAAPDLTRGDGQIRVEWGPPSDDGGDAITGYSVQHRPTSPSNSRWTQTSGLGSTRRSHLLSRLTNGTEYEVQVRASNSAGAGGWSPSGEATPADEPERSTVRVDEVSDGSAEISWNAPDDNGSSITGYRVQHRRKSPSNSRWTQSSWLAPTIRGYTVSGLTNGVAYEAQVKARNGVGEASWSSSVEFTPANDELALVSVPSLRSSSTTTTSITIRWDAVSGGHRYEVQWRRAGSSDSWDGPHSVRTSTSYTATMLDEDTEYDFQARARGDGNSHSSDWTRWSATLTDSTDAPAPRPTRPAAPTNGSAAVRAVDGSLELSWTRSEGADRYEVRIEGRNGSVVYTATNVPQPTGARATHVILGLQLAGLSGSQTAEVKACNSEGCSGALDVSFLPPAPSPANFEAEADDADGKTAIDLSWDRVESTNGFEHDYWDVAAGGPWLDVPGSTRSTSRTVSGLMCGKEYTFRARSYGDGTSYYSEWGPWSENASATTEPCNSDPEFEHETYAFRAAPAAAAGTVVGTVRATDDVEVVRYTLSGSDLFSISKNAHGDGVIAVARTLAESYADPIALTVTATDADDATDTAAVTISVSTTAPTESAPAPTLTLESRDNTSITVSWPSVDGADNYRAQHKTSTHDDYTGSITTRTTTGYTAAGLLPGTSYDLHAASHGDGATYAAGWGDWSDDFTASTTIPPLVGCENDIETLSAPVARTGEWAEGCDSTNRSGRHARYVTFTLASPASVTVELVSATDPYLFLLEGSEKDGDVLARNDDSRDDSLGRLNSRIVYSAEAGTYTAEATTFSSGRTGSFEIRIRGDFVDPPDPPTGGSATWNAETQVLELSWNDSPTSNARYNVGISGNSYTADGLVLSRHSISGDDLSGLEDSQTATVEACLGDVCSEAIEISFLPPAPPPAMFVARTHDRTTVHLGWDRTASATRYEVEYRKDDETSWTDAPRSTASTAMTIPNLDCGVLYKFRVRSRGSGPAYVSDWGVWSEPEDATTTATQACNQPPEFQGAPYSFEVGVQAESGDEVGTVLADDPDGTVVAYSLDVESVFDISDEGVIALAAETPGSIGDTVTLEVTATDDEGATAMAAITIEIVSNALAAVAVPTNLRSTGQTTTSVSIAWDAPQGAAAYQVLYKRTDSAQWLGPAGADAASYTRENLPAGTSYDFKVRARGDGTSKSSAWSLYSDAFTESTIADECAVQDLGPLAISSSATRDAEWTSACSAENRPGRYAKFFSFTLAEPAHVVVELVSTTQILDPDASPTDTYLLLLKGAGTDGRVLERNDDSRDEDLGRRNSRIASDQGAGTYTAEATTYRAATAGSFTITVRPLTPAPPKPGAGSASVGADDGLVTLSWDASAGAAEYRLNLFDSSYSATVDAPATSTIIPASEFATGSGERIAYVTACNSDGACSGLRFVRFVPPPPAPSNLDAAADGENEIDLTWSRVADATRYEVEYKEDSETAWTDVQGSTQTTSETVDGLMCGTEYDFRVRAHGDGTRRDHWGPWSETASAQTGTCTDTNRPPAPRNVQVVPGVDKLVVFWDPPERVPQDAVYEVQITESTGGRSRRAILDDPIDVGGDTAYEAASLDPARRYEVQVRTKVGAHTSLWSNSIVEGPAALGISISHVGANPLEIGQNTDIGVTATGTKMGVSYFVHYETDPDDTLSFGSCTRPFYATRVPGIDRRDPLHGCMVGEASITAKLQVGNGNSGYFDLAESVPTPVTVNPATARLEMEGLEGSPIWELGNDSEVVVSASYLRANTSYIIEMTSTDPDAVGFDVNCGKRNSILPSSTSGSATTVMHTLQVYACGSVAHSQLTAELKIDGAVVKRVSASPRVRPPIPADLRVHGKGSGSGYAMLRLETDGRAQIYEVEYRPDGGEWNTRRLTAEDTDYRQINGRRVLQLEVELGANRAVELRVKAKREDGSYTIPSADWSEKIWVWVAQSKLPSGEEYHSAFAEGVYIYRTCPGSAGFGADGSNEYATWESRIEAGAETWERAVKWTRPDGTNVLSARKAESGDCADGREFTNNVVKGFSPVDNFLSACWGNKPEYSLTERAAVACTKKEDATPAVRSVFFRMDGVNWDLTDPARGPCEYATTIAAHEAGHAFGLKTHLEEMRDEFALMHDVPQEGVCEPGVRDAMYLMGLYQKTTP